MAYFPNGTAGMFYEDKYCQDCAHDTEDGCPVMLLHNLFNYDQCDEDARGQAIKTVLSVLIPETPDKLGAEKCSMFTPRDEAEESEQRRLAEQPHKYRQVLSEMGRA